jgi:hypothetical protein
MIASRLSIPPGTNAACSSILASIASSIFGQSFSSAAIGSLTRATAFPLFALRQPRDAADGAIHRPRREHDKAVSAPTPSPGAHARNHRSRLHRASSAMVARPNTDRTAAGRAFEAARTTALAAWRAGELPDVAWVTEGKVTAVGRQTDAVAWLQRQLHDHPSTKISLPGARPGRSRLDGRMPIGSPTWTAAQLLGSGV